MTPHPSSLTSKRMDSSEEYKNSGIYNSANIRSVKDGGGGAEEEAPPPAIPSTTQQSMLKKHQQSMIESPMFNTSNAARHHIPRKRRRPLQTFIQQQHNRRDLLKHTINHNKKQNTNKLHRRTIRRAPSGSNATRH